MIDGYYAVDYHMHSIRSHDGKATIPQQCMRAIEIGLDEICFTEHKDFNPDDPVVNHFDYNLYADEIASAREQYGDKLTIRMGVELDYQSWFEDLIGEYLVSHAFDLLVSSVHHTRDGMVMSPKYIQSRDARDCYHRYFQEVICSAQSGYADVIGHLEYANRRGVGIFGTYEPEEYEDMLRELFSIMIAKGISLEINTAGLRQGIDMTYPCEKTVDLYAECGGKLLNIGSDAHKTNDLGANYITAVDIALRHGLNEVCVWKNRNPRGVKLTRVNS